MKYAILNSIDRPYERLVCELVDGKYYYLQRAVEEGLRDYDGMEPRDDTTSMEDFGFDCIEDASGLEVCFIKRRESVARYESGEIRPWQGKVNFTHKRVKLT